MVKNRPLMTAIDEKMGKIGPYTLKMPEIWSTFG